MKYRALIPVKTLNEAKSRLAPYLTPSQRAILMLDMLHHVVSVLRASNAFGGIAIVSSDTHVLERASAWGVQQHYEERRGHNSALHTAALQELSTGAEALLTISADLPFLQTQDISSMLELSRQYSIVLAQSHDGTGTNALLTHPPLAIPYVFGPGSLQRFRNEAQQHHLGHTLCQCPGLALDIDTIDDLERLRCYEIANSELAGTFTNPDA